VFCVTMASIGYQTQSVTDTAKREWPGPAVPLLRTAGLTSGARISFQSGVRRLFENGFNSKQIDPLQERF
jgi:hypothetical protein